jgi:hypothetical protein
MVKDIMQHAELSSDFMGLPLHSAYTIGELVEQGIPLLVRPREEGWPR